MKEKGKNDSFEEMDAEPVDLSNDGVEWGNTTEQNGKDLTEISKDNHDDEMTENNFSFERDNELANLSDGSKKKSKNKKKAF